MIDKIKKIIIIILTFILVYKIIDISAAYKTMLNSEIKANIEPWKILVNNVNIATKEFQLFEVNTLIESSENIRERKICSNFGC